jgi:hypothetical protein
MKVMARPPHRHANVAAIGRPQHSSIATHKGNGTTSKQI